MFLLAFGLFTMTASAQLGIRVGANFTDLKLSDEFVTAATNSQTGFHAGLNYNLGLGPIGLEIGAYWTSVGTQLNLANPTFESVTSNVDLNYIQVPIALRFNLIPLIYVKAGGYVAGQISAATEIVEVANGQVPTDPLDFAEDLNSFDAGLVFGLGVKVSKLEIEGGFDLGLKNIYSADVSTDGIDFDVDPSNIDMKNAVYKVGVTYRF